ncbi:ankyrin repeat-containing domain protein [Aspergillus carlsbadensis]|nr:ankyrin repeat-containing domain protein [Aspergillus carlsbadensis]
MRTPGPCCVPLFAPRTHLVPYIFRPSDPRSSTMRLLNRPPELIDHIAGSIPTEKDLSFFARTCRHVYNTANRHLYRRNPSALFWAVESGGREDLVRKCLSYGVNIHIRNADGLTPDAVAAELDYSSIVQILLNHPGADPNEKIANGRSLLTFAVVSDARAVVDLLLSRGDVGLDIADDRGATPLWHMHATELLLDTLCDIFPTVDVVVQLAWRASARNRQKIPLRLIRRFKHQPETIERIIGITIRTTNDAAEAEVFLRGLWWVHARISDDAVLTTIRRFGKRLLNTIFSERGPIGVTDEILKIAAGHEDGRDIVEILLGQATAVQVTDEGVRAIEGETSGRGIILLLQSRGLVAG